jgi:hypothetical protein
MIRKLSEEEMAEDVGILLLKYGQQFPVTTSRH